MTLQTSKFGESIILTIDLGHQKDDLRFSYSDNAEELSKDFCIRNNLDINIQQSICEFLTSNFFNKETIKKKAHVKTTEDVKLSPVKEKKIITKSTSPINHNKSQISSASSIKSPKKDIRENSINQLPGERLYYAALDNMRSKKELNTKIIAERKACELSEVTFKPRINSKSPKPKNLTPEIQLLEKYRKSKRKLENQKRNILLQRQKDCSFSPIINKKSKELNKSDSKDRNIQLFENFKTHQEKIAQQSQLL